MRRMRRSKTPKPRRKSIEAEAEHTPILKQACGTPQTDRTSKEEQDDNEGMVMQVPLISPSSQEPSHPTSHLRARSLSRSRSPFWVRRKQAQEYASKIYDQHESGIGTRSCTDIFRKCERDKESTLEVDYMPRQFSSDYSFVEVVLGDYVSKQRSAALGSTTSTAIPPSSPASNRKAEVRRNQSTSDLPILVPARKRSSKKEEHKAAPYQEDAGGLPVVSPPEQEAAVNPRDVPITAIELKRRRSDFVSELSMPPVVQRQTVTSVRKALIKAQRRLAGASRWGKKVSPEILLQAFMEVAESLESKDDKEILRREMERLIAESKANESETDEESSASETEESTADESYVPVGMCQFPGAPVVVDDDLSETSSFADWLSETEEKRGKWKSTLDVFNLSNLWTDKLSAEWEKFLQESDDDEPVTTLRSIRNPPQIERINSARKGFVPRSTSGTSHAKLFPPPIRSISRQRSSANFEPCRKRSIEAKRISLKNRVPEMPRTKTMSAHESDKALVSSFPLDPFANEEWIEKEAQRILRQKSLQRIRTENEKRKAEEGALKQRAAETDAEKKKGTQHRMIDKHLLDQFETTNKRSGLSDTSPRNRSATRQRAKSLQRSLPGQIVSKPDLPTTNHSGYHVYRPEIFPKFAAHDDSASIESIQTNNFGGGVKQEDTTPSPVQPSPPRNTTLPYTQRLLARKKEQSRRRQMRSKSVDAPCVRGNDHRLIRPRQKV